MGFILGFVVGAVVVWFKDPIVLGSNQNFRGDFRGQHGGQHGG